MITYTAIAHGWKADGIASAETALERLVWRNAPGMVLRVDGNGQIFPVCRLDDHGTVYGYAEHPISDFEGSVYCPQCHAGPGAQEPDYVEGTATGSFTCRRCLHTHRPGPLDAKHASEAAPHA
jgi:hypothetical protein